MAEQDFIPYREAMARQPAELIEIARHVTEQLDRAPVEWSGAPAFLGIGASLAAAALPVALLRARGGVAQRVDVGDLGGDVALPGRPTIAISQSGRSRETIEAVAGHAGDTLALVNVAASPLTQVVGASVDLGSRLDSKASTVGFTGTLLALGLIASRWSAPRPTPVIEVQRLGDAVSELIDAARLLDPLAELVDKASSIDVVGLGPSVASAEEAALLLREVARIPAAGFELRNFLHGSAESAHPLTGPAPTLQIVLGRERSLQLVAQLHDAGCAAALVTDLEPAATADLRSRGCPVVTLPTIDPVSRVVLEVVVAQLLSDAVASARGYSPEEFIHSTFDTKVDDLHGA